MDGRLQKIALGEFYRRGMSFTDELITFRELLLLLLWLVPPSRTGPRAPRRSIVQHLFSFSFSLIFWKIPPPRLFPVSVIPSLGFSAPPFFLLGLLGMGVAIAVVCGGLWITRRERGKR